MHTSVSITSNLKLSREKITRLSHVLTTSLAQNDQVEFHDEDNKIRLTILKVIENELKRDSDIDHSVRKKIENHRRPILDGSREWDILYKKYFEEEISRLRRFSE